MIRKIISIFVSVLFVPGIYFKDYLLHKFGIISGLILFILIVGILLVIFLNIKKDRVALYTSIAALLTGIGILIVLQTGLFKSKILMKAILVDDLSSLELTLRQNSTFELLLQTYLGPGKPFKGKFKMDVLFV